MEKTAKNILKNTFGYDQFRPMQEDIINNVMKKRDTLVIMPTGGGKSLCYQIPGLLFEGLTVVVSPLISLMKDQVEQLQQLGVAAKFLNSSLKQQEYNAIIEHIKEGRLKLLYLAPEGLLTDRVLSVLKPIKIDCLTIDEAHCISEWGHDFRPEYRRLVKVRQQFPESVCVALTATATERVQQDIMDSLNFEKSNEFIASYDRENLFLEITAKYDAGGQTVDFIKKHPDQSGIIYCLTRRQVDELAAYLKVNGYSVLPYHAGLADNERRRNQELFIKDDVQIMVATIAFGMGINKPNVRYVVHYDLPKNIESYYQQIGRAGRDGLPARCLLLFGYGDLQKIRYFIDQTENLQERKIALVHLDEFVRFCESHLCRRIPLLRYFGEKYKKQNCSMCDNCTGNERELTDVTVAAQKFLSCVKRTGERFGAVHIIDVLRGSQNKKVLDFGHQNLTTYAIGKEYSKQQWLILSRQFIQNELLHKDQEHGGLTLTPKSSDVLFNGQKVLAVLETKQVEVLDAKQTDLEYDVELFRLLRQQRKVLADRQNVPPYVIFSDKSLVEMATWFPQSRHSLMDIYGVGATKVNRYGTSFLHIIQDYCKEQKISERQKSTTRITATPISMSKKRYQQIGDAYEKYKSIKRIEKEYGIKISTIVAHLLRWVNEGHVIPPGDILTTASLTSEQQKKVLDSFLRHGTDFLRPVYDDMNGTISYEKLHLMRLYFLVIEKK